MEMRTKLVAAAKRLVQWTAVGRRGASGRELAPKDAEEERRVAKEAAWDRFLAENLV